MDYSGMSREELIAEIARLREKSEELERRMARAPGESGARDTGDEEKFRRIIEDIHEVIYSLDMNGVVEYVSPGIQKLTGYLPEEITGRHFTGIVLPEDIPFILEEFAKILDEQYGPSDYRIVRKDGTSFYVQTNSKIIKKNGVPVAITGVLTDIDSLKNSEERLREQNARYEELNSKLSAKNEELESMYEEMMAANEELEATNQELVAMQQTLLDANVRHEKSELRYRTLFEHSPIPIFEGDGLDLKVLVDEIRQSGVEDFARYFREHHGVIWQFVKMIRVLSVNRAFLDLFEAERGDNADLDIRKYFTDETLRFFRDRLLELISGVHYSEGETEMCTLSGKRIYGMLRLTVPAGYEENWSRILISIFDLTERRILEEKVLQSQKMEAVGRLAGGVAHDFNNLLTVITGNTGILLSDSSCTGSLRTMLEEIQLAGEKGADLTRQLLAFSRKQMMRPVALGLNDVVRNIEKMLRRLVGENIEMHTVLDPGLGIVRADPGQIEQVLVNLVVNARDAMPKAGTITISTANDLLDKERSNESGTIPAGSYVTLSVKDTGIGIDRSVRDHIFEPFFTTKDVGKGVGLGLATVYGILKQSGGFIEVASDRGVGSTFTVFLPRAEREEKNADRKEISPLRLEGNETVMVIEDDPMVREMIRRVLEHYGYSVIISSGPADALTFVQGDGGSIQCVITDVVMPTMDGFELAHKIRARQPDVKVLYITGYMEESMTRAVHADEHAVLLHKPFSPNDLLVRVRGLLDGKSSG